MFTIYQLNQQAAEALLAALHHRADTGNLDPVATYRITGDLTAVAYRLSYLLDHLATGLDHRSQTHQLHHIRGGDPAATVTEITSALRNGATDIRAVDHALSRCPLAYLTEIGPAPEPSEIGGRA